MSRTYATETDFEDWLEPEPVPDGAARLLRDASVDVDAMLTAAIYRVDHDGNPTEQHMIDALRDATCAQAEHRDEYGDDVTIMQSSETVALGPLRLGGTGKDGTATIPQYSPRAVRILRNAGLMPGVVLHG